MTWLRPCRVKSSADDYLIGKKNLRNSFFGWNPSRTYSELQLPQMINGEPNDSEQPINPMNQEEDQQKPPEKQKTKRELFEWGQGCKINERPKLLLGKEVKQISCGGSHAAAILFDGTIYVWGDGRSGQLGLGNEIKKVEQPTCIMHDFVQEEIVKIWSGFASTAAFTKSGGLYFWGFDPFQGPIFTPSLFKKYATSSILDVAFGPSMTMILISPNNSPADTDVQVLFIFQSLNNNFCTFFKKIQKKTKLFFISFIVTLERGKK